MEFCVGESTKYYTHRSIDIWVGGGGLCKQVSINIIIIIIIITLSLAEGAAGYSQKDRSPAAAKLLGVPPKIE